MPLSAAQAIESPVSAAKPPIISPATIAVPGTFDRGSAPVARPITTAPQTSAAVAA